jgi:hypothetical protein
VADYATTAQVKARLSRTDDRDDTTIAALITASSRLVEEMTNRRFDQTVETRYFTPTGTWYADIDDLVSLTQVATDIDGNRTYTEVWTANDYELEPVNSASRSFPFTQLAITPQGTRSFPVLRRGVRIAGTWGWPAVPQPVTEATILMTIRLFKRTDAPFGVVGSTDLGNLQTLPARDPDIAAMLAPYRRFAVGVI